MKKLLGILVLSLLWCNVGFADAASVKKACRDLGFEPGTELFLDCALKLMSQEKQSDQNIIPRHRCGRGRSVPHRSVAVRANFSAAMLRQRN